MEKKEQVQEIFGKVLRGIRLEKNLKQSELAEKSKMDDTYISDLERGKYMPSLLTVIKISNGLDISLVEFAKRFSQSLK